VFHAPLRWQYEVMVTAGANQAFVNLVLTLCDESDSVVLFKPYYFNHMCVMRRQHGTSHHSMRVNCLLNRCTACRMLVRQELWHMYRIHLYHINWLLYCVTASRMALQTTGIL
jgi:hypothetical protein